MQSFFWCMHFNKCQLIERDLSRCYAPSLLESLQPRLVSEVHTRAVDDGHHPEQLARHLPVLPLSVVGDHMVPTSWCSLNNHFTEAQAISHLIRGATEVVAKVRVRFALPYMPTTCLFRVNSECQQVLGRLRSIHIHGEVKGCAAWQRLHLQPVPTSDTLTQP